MTQTNIERNNVAIPFVEEKFRRGEKKKAGLTYVAPGSEVTLQTYIDFLGTEVAKEIIDRQFKLWCQHWTKEATDESSGTLDLSEFEKFVKTLSARGETIKSLLGKRDELFDLMAELDPTVPEDAVKFAKYAGEAKKVKEALAEKRDKSEDNE
jgi:hypothetical protein